MSFSATWGSVDNGPTVNADRISVMRVGESYFTDPGMDVTSIPDANHVVLGARATANAQPARAAKLRY